MKVRAGFVKGLALFLLLLVPGAGRLIAQEVPLLYVNKDTRVSKISFRFNGPNTIDERLLRTQIATAAPGFWDKVRKVFPFMSGKVYPFIPVELQRDVVRLERYYENNGFLHPSIDYAGSRLDTAANAIHVIFSINEGPPLVIQDVEYLGPDGRYARYAFQGEPQASWDRFQQATTVHAGERYTDFDRTRIQDAALAWLKDNGYAFATVRGSADVDSVNNWVDLSFVMNPGPLATVDSIIVEGNESVARNVIVREMPLQPGMRFDNRRLTLAQRELFSLSLFRSALTDIPQQPIDSTVSVRVRVREAKRHYVSAQTGYDREQGVGALGEWTHRNFMGGARQLTINVIANSGILAAPSGGVVASRLFKGSFTLQQPYLFSRHLSAFVTPYIQAQRNPNIPESDALIGINSGQIGNTTRLLYEFFPFRTATVQHDFNQILLLNLPTDTTGAPGQTSRENDYYVQSTISSNAVLGKVDDFFNPTRGFLVRPFAEISSVVIGSDVQYFRAGTEASAYRHLAAGLTGAARLYLGRVWPKEGTGRRFRDLTDPNSNLENRLDPIFFYSGGSNDLRGWGLAMAGRKTIRLDVFTRPNGTQDTLFVYEPVGALARLGMNFEVRSRIPGMGSAWRGALFLDTGALGDEIGKWDWKMGTGVGIRYFTMIGYIRFDLAYKINPDDYDLRHPESVWRAQRENPPTLPKPDPWKRWGFHFSIGQAF